MAIDMQARPDTEEEAPEPLSRGVRLVVTLVVVSVATLVLWAAAPDAVTATFSGPGPLLRVVGVILGFILFSVVVRRLVPNPWVARAIVIVPALAVSWWALSPYFGDDVVDEAFPVVAEAPATTDASKPASDQSGPAANDAANDAAAAPAPDESATAGSAPSVTPPPATAAPAEPIALGSGTFQGLTGHRGAGVATVYELADGTRALRLEDFDVSNGPGLEVHLVPGADQRRPGGGVKLADLKGNVGNQNYDIPPELDLTGDWTVLIWCEPFTVEVANATATF